MTYTIPLIPWYTYCTGDNMANYIARFSEWWSISWQSWHGTVPATFKQSPLHGCHNVALCELNEYMSLLFYLPLCMDNAPNSSQALPTAPPGPAHMDCMLFHIVFNIAVTPSWIWKEQLSKFSQFSRGQPMGQSIILGGVICVDWSPRQALKCYFTQ